MELEPIEPTEQPPKPAPAERKRIRIGDLLVEKGLITEAQLMLALQEQKVSGKKIGRVLVDLGMISETKLLEMLGAYLNIPFLEMKFFQLDHSVSLSLDESHARRYRVLVLSQKDDGYLLGMADASDLVAQDEVERALGKPVYPAILRESELLATLDLVYRKHSKIQSIAGELDSELRSSDFVLEQLGANVDTTDAPVVRLLQSIMEDAVQTKASDVHIEPDESGLRVRQRVDGVLQEQVIKEKRIASALVLRLKIMANLDISEKRLPQDGRFNIQILNHSIDIRLSTLPTQWGESVVMRLLDQTTGILSMPALGMPSEVQSRFELNLERPHGLILVTGPTGSGKTTTLYAALSQLNSPKRKIITAEDPIEYRLPRINQVQVNTKIDFNFSTILRSALRQDPDVILIGEMRDQETVAIGVRAALTGHLVLSTLHTNDAVSSAMRLTDMGVEPWLIASALRAIVAQRLVKRVCQNCAEPHQPDPQQRIWLEHIAKGKHAVETLKFVKGRGCYRCNNTGYSGRIGVFELLELDENMLRALRNNDADGFATAARESGFVTMSERALAYALQGMTDLDEVFRITSDLFADEALG